MADQHQNLLDPPVRLGEPPGCRQGGGKKKREVTENFCYCGKKKGNASTLKPWKWEKKDRLKPMTGPWTMVLQKEAPAAPIPRERKGSMIGAKAKGGRLQGPPCKFERNGGLKKKPGRIGHWTGESRPLCQRGGGGRKGGAISGGGVAPFVCGGNGRGTEWSGGEEGV